MEQGSYTPGPWKARDYPNDDRDIWIDAPGKAGTVAMAFHTGIGTGSVEANARLIAMAPTMLTGLKLALAEFERISYQIKASPEVIDCLETAIAKASR